MTFTPCSPKHKSCSPTHADMVREYQRERERQERQLEHMTGNYPGDIIHWEAKGGKLIDFHTWLKANRRTA
jgi:hypothetical protein